MDLFQKVTGLRELPERHQNPNTLPRRRATKSRAAAVQRKAKRRNWKAWYIEQRSQATARAQDAVLSGQVGNREMYLNVWRHAVDLAKQKGVEPPVNRVDEFYPESSSR